MPGKVYSERLLWTSGNPGTFIFTIPAGRRAVVRHVAITASGAAGDVALYIAGHLVWYALVQASVAAVSTDVRFTCYAGENLAAVTTGNGVYCTMNGFLFEDNSGRTGPLAENYREGETTAPRELSDTSG